MGQMTRDEMIAYLVGLNGAMLRDRVIIYTDSALMYQEANENIARNGVITAHPRTGSPMENPYLKVRKMASETMMKLKVKTGTLWEQSSSG